MSKLVIVLSTALAACASVSPQTPTNHSLPTVDSLGKRQEIIASGQKVLARICTDTNGNVTTVALERPSGIGTFDKAVETDLMSWKFDPQAAPSCRKLTVVYKQEA